MSLRSLRHLFEPERILWVGPEGPVARWVHDRGEPISGTRASSGPSIPCAAPVGRPRRRGSTGWRSWPRTLASRSCACRRPICPALLDDLAAVGGRAIVVIGGGAGPVALDAEQARAMRAAARRHGVRVIGPDRVGVMVPRLKLNAGSAAQLPPDGDLAFVTQSDSIATAMLDWATDQRIGFSRVVSLGESADVELGDILDYLALDLATRAILVHLEGIADARRFMSAARTAARVKPVIVLKAGRQIGPPVPRGQSRRLRLSRDRVYDAAFSPGRHRPGRHDRGALRRGRQPRRQRRPTWLRAAQRAAGPADQRPRPGGAGRRHGPGRRRLGRPPDRQDLRRDRADGRARPPRSRARSTSGRTPMATPTPRRWKSSWTRPTSTVSS